MRTAKRSWALLLGLAACGDVSFNFDPAPDGSVNIDPPPPSISTHIREDFDNLQLVDSSNGVIIDVNQGVVTLPAQTFAQVDSDQIETIDADTEANGIVEAHTILVRDDVRFEAADSVDLRARDLLRVTGSIFAGPGGVTLEAGTTLIIDGTIESEGPVRILLSDDDGLVHIGGRVIVRSDEDSDTAISVMSRGRVEISGGLYSTASTGVRAGDILVSTYGSIDIQGFEAEIASFGMLQGTGGHIRLKSESEITLASGATLGFDAEHDYGTPLGGDIELQADRVELEEGTRILAAGHESGDGGSVLITTADLVRAGRSTLVEAGSGDTGGSLVLRAERISLGEGSQLLAGSGLKGAGSALLEASQSVGMGRESLLQGGGGGCVDGGRVTISVAGPLTVDAGARIRGGAGGELQGTTSCAAVTSQGGSVEIIAHEGLGLEEAVMAGEGPTDGSISVNMSADHVVPAPNLTVGTAGWITSVTIDRGEEAARLSPRLVQIAAQIPEGTSIGLLLAGSHHPDGPFESYAPLMLAPNRPLEAVAGHRYLRYRISLRGRVFDAPELDYFEIELAPVY